MKLTLIPLLIAALLLATADPDIETVEVVLSGEHQVTEHRGALIVGDAHVSIPHDAQISGPIYLIGGELVVSGRIDTDVIQLAGSLSVEPGADVAGELRHIGGVQNVSTDSHIGERSSLYVNPAGASPIVRVGSTILLALLLALASRRLARKRISALENVAKALRSHPTITLTVGVLLTLTSLSIFVFMAFTLILIPVTIVGLLAGIVILAYGLIAWGYLIGTRLPMRRHDLATALGVVVAIAALQAVALIPLVGDPIALALLLAGVGAVAVTYFGVTDFKPEVLPE